MRVQNRIVALLIAMLAIVSESVFAQDQPASLGETLGVAKQRPHASEVRRVWVLSDPGDGGVSKIPGAREIMVYDLTCEAGELTEVAEAFKSGAEPPKSGPTIGTGWVIRTQEVVRPNAASEKLQHSLAEVCGI
ncbi:MAG: hypothetical protein ABI612_26255 [Betaproteobacteria bacterium]